MKEQNDAQELQLSLCEELGIVELDARLDMAFDPLATVMALPTNGNCHGCNGSCKPKMQ